MKSTSGIPVGRASTAKASLHRLAKAAPAGCESDVVGKPAHAVVDGLGDFDFDSAVLDKLDKPCTSERRLHCLVTPEAASVAERK